MSWRLLLSEYPDALLTDRLALVILVLLEQGGLVTESEIQEQLEIDQSDVVQKFLALHRDKCIEYFRNHIRITDRGRQLVDRFALSDEIVEDLLTRLPISAPRRTDFKNAILQYRKHAFDQYLKSVKDVRYWSYATQLKALGQSERKETAQAGSLAIFMSDIKRYLGAESIVVHFSGHGDTAGLVETPLPDQLPSDNPAESRAFEWLALSYALEDSKTPWQNVRRMKSSAKRLFLAFELCRNAMDSNRWLDEWSTDGECFRALSFSPDGRAAVDRMADLCEPIWGRWHDRLVHRRERLARAVPFGNISDFLLKMFAASTLEELIKSTDLDKATLETLLTQIAEHCRILLESANDQEESTGQSASEESKEIGG